MATHRSVLAWEIPWTEEPGGPRSMGSQRAGQSRTRPSDSAHMHFFSLSHPCSFLSLVLGEMGEDGEVSMQDLLGDLLVN